MKLFPGFTCLHLLRPAIAILPPRGILGLELRASGFRGGHNIPSAVFQPTATFVGLPLASDLSLRGNNSASLKLALHVGKVQLTHFPF